MLKIIRLLLFCLILDAYCERILADPWEPDGSWITFDATPLTPSQNNQSDDDTSYNKEREYSKIINFIRDIKSLIKKNQRKTAKRRKENAKSAGKESVPIRASSTDRKMDDGVVKVNRKNRTGYHEILNKVRRILLDRRKKITQLKVGEEKPEKYTPNQVSFSNKQKQSPIDKKKVQPSKSTKDKVSGVSTETEKVLSKKPKPSFADDDQKKTGQYRQDNVNIGDDSSSKLLNLINLLKKLDHVSTSAEEPTEQPETQEAANREKPRDLLKDQALWIGLVTGCCLAAMVCATCFFISVLIRDFKRKRDGDKRPLDLNFNCPPDSYKKRHYSAFSHIHDPKTGRRFIVLKDNSENYSITSSGSSSEEEIYNASQQSPSKPVLNASHRSSVNRTSTPIKSPLRLTRSAPGSPAVRRDLSKSWTSPPVSPLASVTPVFASPIKLPGGEGHYSPH